MKTDSKQFIEILKKYNVYLGEDSVMFSDFNKVNYTITIRDKFIDYYIDEALPHSVMKFENCEVILSNEKKDIIITFNTKKNEFNGKKAT